MRISDWSSDVWSSDLRPALPLPVGHQVDRARIGQWRLEGVGGLSYQRHAVGEEQHALDPVGAHQQIDQRDRDAGLAGAGGHGQQAGAATLRQRLGHRTDGAHLVRALRTEENTSELQSLMRKSYADFGLNKKQQYRILL